MGGDPGDFLVKNFFLNVRLARKFSEKNFKRLAIFFPSGRSKIMDEKKFSRGRFDLAIKFFS